MATRQRTTVYRTNGSAAYAPAYSGNTVRVPRRRGEPETLPKQAPKRRPESRPQVQVRAAGQVAPLAVLGFLIVGLVAALLLMSTLDVHVAEKNIASLKNQLTTLQTQHEILTAQYEQVFDVERLQGAVGSEMTRPTADQITYIDMSKPDSVQFFDRSRGATGAGGAVSGAREIVDGLVEYFG